MSVTLFSIACKIIIHAVLKHIYACVDISYKNYEARFGFVFRFYGFVRSFTVCCCRFFIHIFFQISVHATALRVSMEDRV